MHDQSRDRQSLAPISAEQEVEIGQQQYAPSQQIQGGDYSLDAALTAYVRCVGAKLAAVSDRELPYEFVVLNNSVSNARALPGGKIADNRRTGLGPFAATAAFGTAVTAARMPETP